MFASSSADGVLCECVCVCVAGVAFCSYQCGSQPAWEVRNGSISLNKLCSTWRGSFWRISTRVHARGPLRCLLSFSDIRFQHTFWGTFGELLSDYTRACAVLCLTLWPLPAAKNKELQAAWMAAADTLDRGTGSAAARLNTPWSIPGGDLQPRKGQGD